jgi:hypothetical protein
LQIHDHLKMDIRVFPSIDTKKGERLIIVGDVHGCVNELKNLLDAVQFRNGTDYLLLLGDLVNKGYDSVGVVRAAMNLKRCFAVLGNHDVALMNQIRSYHDGEVSEKNKDSLAVLARQFPRDCADYLQKLPYIYKIPQFNLIAVHAGLNPTRRLEEQLTWEVLHMRGLDKTGETSELLGKKHPNWARQWPGPETVIFGHDARSGLQREKFALGLDTGCCYGGLLSAVVYPGAQLVQVPSNVPKPAKRGVAVSGDSQTIHHADNLKEDKSVPLLQADGSLKPAAAAAPSTSASTGIMSIGGLIIAGPSQPPAAPAPVAATTTGGVSLAEFARNLGLPGVGVAKAVPREYRLASELELEAKATPPTAAPAPAAFASVPSTPRHALSASSAAVVPSGAAPAPPSAAPATDPAKLYLRRLQCVNLLALVELSRAQFEEMALTLIGDEALAPHRETALQEPQLTDAAVADVVGTLCRGLRDGHRGDEVLNVVQELVLHRPRVAARLGATREHLQALLSAGPLPAGSGLTTPTLRETIVTLRH